MNQEHDPYEVVYRIKQLQIAEVNCAFKIFKASLNTYRNDMLSAEMYLWVGTDHSAQSPEFFDIKNHLRISFTARSIERSKNCNELWGDLKINGHNKRVTLIVDEVETITDHQGNERGGLYISGKLNRKDLAGFIAKYIVNTKSSERSFAIGIEAKWGDGKTSFQTNLKPQHRTSADQTIVRVYYFIR